MLTTGCSSWLALAFYFLSLSVGLAQSSLTGSSGQLLPPQLTLQTAAPTQSFQATLASFLANRQALIQGIDSLSAQGATNQQVQAWQEQNFSALQAQQQLVLNLTALSPVQPMTYITVITLPQGVTPELETLLTTHGDLYNRFVELYNTQLTASPGSSASNSTTSHFLQQNAAEIQTQQQQAQVLAAQTSQQASPVPPPLVIPLGSTPQTQAFLTLRDQLVRARIQLQNQYAGSTTAASSAALQQWMQQNAASFQQLHQLGQNISTASPTN